MPDVVFCSENKLVRVGVEAASSYDTPNLVNSKTVIEVRGARALRLHTAVHLTGACSRAKGMILEQDLRINFMDGHRLNEGYSITSGSTDPPRVVAA